MDEIKDSRIQALETSDDWEIRHQEPGERRHVDRISNLETVASVTWFRQQPALKVIHGGLDEAPRHRPRGRLRQARLVVIK